MKTNNGSFALGPFCFQTSYHSMLRFISPTMVHLGCALGFRSRVRLQQRIRREDKWWVCVCVYIYTEREREKENDSRR